MVLVTTIIPAYNEEKTIASVIIRTKQVLEETDLQYRILVVDDGSTDHTANIAENLGVEVLKNGTNMGKGTSLRNAFKLIDDGIVIIMDADDSHPPESIRYLLGPIINGGNVHVVGSRFIKGAISGVQPLNKLLNFLCNVFLSILFRIRITDSQSGFRAIRADTLKKLNLKSDGFEIETEITIKSLTQGYRILELPINCTKRRYGYSRLKLLKGGLGILRGIISSVLEMRRMRE
ncbi:MAG: glycosyltransferase family 2 protein [Candidatus Hodarchaeota archaeon]